MSSKKGWPFYYVKVVKVVDGDTLDLALDVGFGITVTHRFRLLGVDAPEVRGPSKDDGLASKKALGELVAVGILSATVYKTDKYGRYLVELFLVDGTVVNSKLVASGFARDNP